MENIKAFLEAYDLIIELEMEVLSRFQDSTTILEPKNVEYKTENSEEHQQAILEFRKASYRIPYEIRAMQEALEQVCDSLDMARKFAAHEAANAARGEYPKEIAQRITIIESSLALAAPFRNKGV